MCRYSLMTLVAAAGLAMTGCASQSGFEEIAVTRDASVVANCEKLGDIKAEPGTFDQTDAGLQLQRAAREKGANMILVSDAEGSVYSGVAYRCSSPAVTSPSTTPAPGGSPH